MIEKIKDNILCGIAYILMHGFKILFYIICFVVIYALLCPERFMSVERFMEYHSIEDIIEYYDDRCELRDLIDGVVYHTYDDYILEEYYEQEDIKQFLKGYGYVIFDETQDAYELYMYGFASGYEKGINGVHDEEVEEAQCFNYGYLEDKYMNYAY